MAIFCHLDFFPVFDGISDIPLGALEGDEAVGQTALRFLRDGCRPLL